MTIEFITPDQDPAGIEPFRFPGGEWHLRLPETIAPNIAAVTGTSADDLVVLALWADAMHQAGQRAVALLPYLPAARADRGAPFGASVYANLINAAGLDEVVVFDPHSPVAPGLVNHCTVVDSTDLVVLNVLTDIRTRESYSAVLAPDAGARDRAASVAHRVGLPFLIAEKHRDFATGRIESITVPTLPHSGKILVVDDICDGGGTFIGLAEAAHAAGVEKDRLVLWVSHGIFSGRADRLAEHFGEIWTTDSHPGATRADVGARVVPLTQTLISQITERI